MRRRNSVNDVLSTLYSLFILKVENVGTFIKIIARKLSRKPTPKNETMSCVDVLRD